MQHGHTIFGPIHVDDVFLEEPRCAGIPAKRFLDFSRILIRPSPDGRSGPSHFPGRRKPVQSGDEGSSIGRLRRHRRTVFPPPFHKWPGFGSCIARTATQSTDDDPIDRVQQGVAVPIGREFGRVGPPFRLHPAPHDLGSSNHV